MQLGTLPVTEALIGYNAETRLLTRKRLRQADLEGILECALVAYRGLLLYALIKAGGWEYEVVKDWFLARPSLKLPSPQRSLSVEVTVELRIDSIRLY
jgi:hypothetical protein